MLVRAVVQRADGGHIALVAGGGGRLVVLSLGVLTDVTAAMIATLRKMRD